MRKKLKARLLNKCAFVNRLFSKSSGRGVSRRIYLFANNIF